jgi:ribosomal protein L11 methyltransferase
MRMPCPYVDLYIYQIEGRPGDRAGMGSRTYLGLWQEEDSAFLFFSAPAETEVGRILREHPQARLIDSCRMPYDQWQGTLSASQRIGSFRISLPWEPPGAPEDSGAIDILLDPGLVFGAGAHPTTRDCLAAIELAAAGRAARTAIDLGTGTGVLALAAARIGSARVAAVDLNALAVRTAARNAALNGLSQNILVLQGRAEEMVDCPADLLIANIHAAVMLRLMSAAGFRAKRQVILSGLMRSEAKEVRRRLELLRFRIVEEWNREGIWHTFYAVKR